LNQGFIFSTIAINLNWFKMGRKA